jgi:NADH dehydrogenase FAD-containing subunit
VLNAEARNLNPTQGEGGGAQGSGTGGELQPFKYRHLGSMATVGGTNAIMELGGANSFKIGTRRGLSIAGRCCCCTWRYICGIVSQLQVSVCGGDIPQRRGLSVAGRCCCLLASPRPTSMRI